MSENRLRRLLEAHRAVMESLDVAVVLRRTVDAAVTLLNALDGAVVLFDRRGLADRVIHVAGSVSRGPLADLDNSDLTPLPEVEREPRRAGISMDDGPEFLAVPLRSHGDAYGALYLTGNPGGSFTPEDEEMIVALAGTAAVALENGRLYDELQRQLRWSTALTEVSSALLSEDVSDAVGVVLARVGTVVAAAVISVVVPDPDSDLLLIHTARGSGAERFEGRRYERRGSLVDRALRSGRVVLSTAGAASIPLEAEMGPSMVLPVMVAGESICALALSRSHGTAPFTADDVDMAAEFATQVGLAIELIRARGDRHRVELAEERSRIARDLHDHVIQRLFGTGLSLQAIAARFPQAEGALIEQVDAIDGAIDEIRTAVFALTSRRRASTGSVRHRILDVVSEMSDSLRVSPQLTFRGPVDLMLTGTVSDDVIAVVRECLANVARHACSDVTTVAVSVDQGSVEVVVTDDGVGVAPDAVRRSGTGNLADRARRRGGDFTFDSATEGGTRAVWWARLTAERSRV